MTSARSNSPNLDFSQLITFVENDELNDIKELITQAKNSTIDWFEKNELALKAAILKATQLNRKNIMEFFLENGISANLKITDENKEETRLLTLATRAGHLEMVQLLHQKGAEVTPEVDRFHRVTDDSAIINAVIGDNADVVEYLLKNGANVHAVETKKWNQRETLLAKAAKNKNYRIIHLLIKFGISIESTIALAHEALQNQSRNNPDLETLKQIYLNMVQQILDHAFGIDFDNLNFLKGFNVAGLNFIGISIKGHPITSKMLNELRFEGADQALVCVADIEKIEDRERKKQLAIGSFNAIYRFNASTSEDGTVNLIPLWRAAEKGDIETVKARLAAGIDPNNGEEPPIVLAAKHGHVEVVQELAKQPTIDNATLVIAIKEAELHHYKDIVTYLLDQIDIKTTDKKGNSVLHHAAQISSSELTYQCIKKNADVNATNTRGETPLFFASKEKREDGVKTLEILLDHGAKPSLEKWCRSINEALKVNNVAAVERLLPHIDKKPVEQYDMSSQKTVMIPWYVDFIFNASYNLNMISLFANYPDVDFNTPDVSGNRIICKLTDEVIYHVSAPRNIDMKQFDENLAVMDFLVKHGVDVNLSGSEGYPPLHLFVKEITLNHANVNLYKLVLSWFIENGADLKSKNTKEQTLLELFQERNEPHSLHHSNEYLEIHHIISNAMLPKKDKSPLVRQRESWSGTPPTADQAPDKELDNTQRKGMS